MSIPNTFVDNNNNPLNILQSQQPKKIMQETAKIPKNIGPYEIISKIKDGGYSKIYLAKSKYTGDDVCIKLIEKTSFQENVEDLLLATRQIEALKILNHRNIVSLFEIYETPNYICLVTEYLSGKDLIEHLIIKKRFTEDEAQKIFFQLADALYYMHQMNICHRDIRTDHIVFDKNKMPKIVGFAYSSFYNKINNKNVKLKDSFGSLCYACPELIQEIPYDPELADVWSLGVVLYVMVCGYLPFSEEDDGKNKELIIEGKIEYPNEISNKLKDLLKHMLDVNSEKRYNFAKIIKHPWFKPFKEYIVGGCNLHKMIYPIDEKILNIIQIYGFNKKQIENDMKINKFNIGTGLYRHLVIKLKEMGFTSLSDLWCSDYCNYKNDKNNFYKNGDEKYNTYLNVVQKKIEKMEKVICDFQEKEENIINQLNKLEDTNNNLPENEIKKSNNYSSNNTTKNNNAKILENADKLEKISKFNNKNNIKNFNNCPNEVEEPQNDIPKTTNKKIIHKRTLTPIFASRGFDHNEIDIDINDNNVNDVKNPNIEIGHINQKEMEIINKSKKAEKRKNILLNINKEFYLNDKDNKTLKRSNSVQNIKYFVKQLLNSKLRCNNKNRNSKINDITKRVDDSHIITSSNTKWLDTSMVIKRKKKYLNCSSFLDGYLKKPHPDNLRKNEVKISLLNDINKTIIEENNNSINNNSENNNNNINNNKNNGIRKSKQIRYSLSFGEDDEEDESSYISKIDSKQLSVFDDEEIKTFRELGLVNRIKSPNLKANNNSNNNSGNSKNNNENNIIISNFNEKNQNVAQPRENKSKKMRNSKINKKNENKNNDNPILVLYKNKDEMSFHEDLNKDIKTTNINTNFNNNINKINNNINKNENKEDDSNLIFKNNNTNIPPKKEEKREICVFYNDKKKLSKLNIFYKYELPSISTIDNKEKNKYSYSYYNDIFTIKKLENISMVNCSISDIDKFKPHKKEDSKKNNNYYIIRKYDLKISQRKTLEIGNNKKEKNESIIENKKNAQNSREISGKNSNLKNSCANNGLTDKKFKKLESLEDIDNNNKASKLEKDNNKKIVKNINYDYRNKEKIKPKKKIKQKNDSELSNKYHEELNITDISDLSEIRTLSILSPTYMNNANVENRIYNNMYDNKENILLANLQQNRSPYISIDKSFQSLYQNQNKPRYHISNLSVSHENNIACFGGKNKITKEKKKVKNNYSMSHFPNNYNGSNKSKKLNDFSNYNINLDEVNNMSNSQIFNNYENYNVYENKSEAMNYSHKNSYDNNYIIAIKKRNLAEKLKEEIQKSKNRNNLNSSPTITNGRINIINKKHKKERINLINDYYLNNSNISNSITINSDIPQSNGKKVRDKFIRSSSILLKNNVSENNPISKNINTLANNYQNNIPLRHYDLNPSQYISQHKSSNNHNISFNKSLYNNNSLNSLNNQTEGNYDNYGRIFMNSKDSTCDYLINYLKGENNFEKYKRPIRKSTIKIKKKKSKSVKSYEKKGRICYVKARIIPFHKSKKKSNGKNKYPYYINKNNSSNTTRNVNAKNNNLLLKSLKYKFLNGNSKDVDFKNSNISTLSKNKKKSDNPNSEKFITCSIPDLNTYRNNKSNSKKKYQLLSDFLLPNSQNNNIPVNQKPSFNKTNEENYGYKKKKSLNINTNNNTNKTKGLNKNKVVYKNENNNINLRNSMDLYNNNVDKSKKVTNKIVKDEGMTKNKKINNYENVISCKTKRKKSGCSCCKNTLYN